MWCDLAFTLGVLAGATLVLVTLWIAGRVDRKA